jgi:low affinity Fe/Cu permease
MDLSRLNAALESSQDWWCYTALSHLTVNLMARTKAIVLPERDHSSFSDRLDTYFTRFAHHTARFAGSPWIFAIAVLVILAWAITGPLFGFSDTWQLVINTSTTIITFLMVFLIQNTQNRDALAVQVKLSELIIRMHGPRNEYAQVEDLTDKELEELHEIIRQNAGCEPLRPRSTRKRQKKK